MTFLLSYDIRWTMKLLRRDLRDLRIKYMTSTKHKCGPVEIARSPSAYQQDQVENKPQVPEDVQYSGVLSECVSEGSVYSKAPQGSPETSSEKRPSTLYELMERRLRATYASRDRNMSHEDRWKFRGSWLLLYKAIQACPSNGSGNGFQYGAKETNDYIMLLDVLSQSTKKGRSSTSKVSKMPATPYTRHDNDHDRYDSMFSDGHIPPPTPSPSRIWLSILEATDDAKKITPMAEKLIEYVWPEKSAVDIIQQVGDPHKKFSDADDAQLRVEFRRLLCPEFISSTPQC
jgi:hypothetical protein